MLDKFHSEVNTDNINTLYNDLNKQGEGQIILNPPYQREIVWEIEKKQFFIDSLYRNIVPTSLIFNVDEEKNQKICIDGKQRCTSIKEFIDNQWPIEIDDTLYFYGPEDKISKNTSDEYENYKIFTAKQRSEFTTKRIPVVIYKNLNYEDQLEIFGRIQHGSPLSDGEKLSSYFDNEKSFTQISDFFDSYKDSECIKKYTKFDRKRYRKFIFDIMFYLNEGLKNKSQKKNTNNFVKKIDKDTKLLKKNNR